MNRPVGIYLGCAGWALSSAYKSEFPDAGTHLQRYGSVFDAVEVNSSFYRAHKPQTWARWAESVPADFRFSVKMPQAITHERRLLACDDLLDAFFAECGSLGERLGCVLMQLPPSLAYDEQQVEAFLSAVRQRFTGALVIEPRHRSWVADQAQLIAWQVARAAADPARFDADGMPSGWPGLQYWRLHGSPQIYHSSYARQYLHDLARTLRQATEQGIVTWCIFDNTASGAALGNALALRERVQRPVGATAAD